MRKRVQKPAKFKFELGEIVKDGVSGFVGTITGRAEYCDAIPSYAVQPLAVGNKFESGNWFSEQRLVFATAGDLI